MKGFNTWAPLISGAYLAIVVGLRIAGQEDAAKGLETVGGLVGITKDPAVSQSELMAFGTLAYGIGRKVWASIQKARGNDDTVSIPVR